MKFSTIKIKIKTMTSILSCPTELIDSILEQVSSGDLAALSLASKKLHTHATPFLYSQVNFSIHRDNPHPLIHLCRSIFKKPELGVHVKSVKLRDGEPKIQELWRESWRYQDKTPKACPPHPTEEDGLPEFISFVANSGLPYADIWIEKLREGDLNAYVALLLSRLPNLKRFRVGHAVVLPYLETAKYARVPPRTKGENQFLGKIFQSAIFDQSNHGVSRFQHLEEISFPGPLDTDPGRNPDFCNPRDMMALLNLPSIRSIRGWCLNPSSLPFTWPAGPPDMANLTSLSLSFVHVDFLGQILERTKSLKSLNWEWKYISGVDPLHSDTFDLDKFVGALKLVQDTLENLIISATNTIAWDDYDWSVIQISGSLDGLQSFDRIKQFQAPFGLLLPDWNVYDDTPKRLEDSVPRNVEVVTLTDQTMPETYGYDEDVELSMLRSWVAETASSRTPHLVEICLYLVWGSNYVEYGHYDRLEKCFEGTNIKHRIIKAEDEKPWEEV